MNNMYEAYLFLYLIAYLYACIILHELIGSYDLGLQELTILFSPTLNRNIEFVSHSFSNSLSGDSTFHSGKLHHSRNEPGHLLIYDVDYFRNVLKDVSDKYYKEYYHERKPVARPVLQGWQNFLGRKMWHVICKVVS